MKKRLLPLLVATILLFLGLQLSAQVGINSDGSQPDPSAMLDVKATDRGLLIPRISSSARNLVPSPATGLIIYNTTTNQINYFNGSYWFQSESTFLSSSIGTINPGGGVSITVSDDMSPANSAMLDINNPTRGILLSRTTPGSIPNPAAGLIIYDTVKNMLSYFNGSGWISLGAVSTGTPGAGGSQAVIGVAIKTDDSSPHSSSMLEVSAHDKGVLIPRLSDAQRDVLLPDVGLLIYNTTINAIEFYNGTGWYQLNTNTTLPGISTNAVIDVTITSATSGGNVTSDGGSPVTARGVCWGTSQNPTIFNNFTFDGAGLGTFTSIITGLLQNTLYYVRAYATNGVGTAFGNEMQFTTNANFSCPNVPNIFYGGQTYNTVQIGTQCWLKENLNIGAMIPGSSEQNNHTAIEKYCYNNDPANCNIYGGLYQWDNVMQWSTTPGVKGICPTGWHIPTDAQWTELTDFLGGEPVAGGQVKESGILHWADPNTGGTNSTGFTALPGGFRSDNGNFDYLTNHATFWSSSQDDATYMWGRTLDFNSEYMNRNYFYRGYGFSVRCLKERNPGDPAIVTTNAVIDITPITAISGGNVTSNGGSQVIARGVCWSISQNPDISHNFTSDGIGTGVYTSTITGLTANTLYYIRAYVTNMIGTSYGNERSFATTGSQGSPCPGIPTITDPRDGKTYNTIQIGTQCWLKENLNIGAMIPGSSEQNNHTAIEKYCYNNDPANCNIYGGLYQWDNVMQWSTTPGVKGICPAGWYIPTNGEWTILTNFLGGEPVAGGLMKEAGTSHWAVPNIGATNISGFTALPGGFRSSNGNFDYLTNYATFWSSSLYNSTSPWGRSLDFNNEYVNRNSFREEYGFSVRCLKCDTATVTTDALINITPTTATSGGNVTHDGGSPVTNRGVCWSISQNPTISDNVTSDGTGTGAFTSEITGLTPNTLYYVRGYATNIVGTGYGNELSFTTSGSSGPPCPGTPVITDVRDGKIYATVVIGSQCWMAQNLNIGNIIPGSSEQTNHNAIEKYCYDNDESNCTVYGGLYQWNNMMQWSTTPGTIGICPTGWHIPTDTEWAALTAFLGGDGAAGGKMKEVGTMHWQPPNTGATNSSWFTALPGGYREDNGNFSYLSYYANFWLSSQDDIADAWIRGLDYNSDYAFTYDNLKIYGFSVRCLKN